MNRRFFLKSTVSLAIAGAVATRPTCSAAQAANTGGYYRLFPSLRAAQFEAGDLLRLANGEGPELPGMSAKPELLLDNNRCATGRVSSSFPQRPKQKSTMRKIMASPRAIPIWANSSTTI